MRNVLTRLEDSGEEGRFGRMGFVDISRGVVGIDFNFYTACGEFVELEFGEVLGDAPV